jgi:hypothetical protein
VCVYWRCVWISIELRKVAKKVGATGRDDCFAISGAPPRTPIKSVHCVLYAFVRQPPNKSQFAAVFRFCAPQTSRRLIEKYCHAGNKSSFGGEKGRKLMHPEIGGCLQKAVLIGSTP